MKSILFSLLFIVVVFSSCQPVHYIPNMHNIPVLTQKGEGAISVGISGGGLQPVSQINLQTSYLLTNHFALKTTSSLHDLVISSNDNIVSRSKAQRHQLGFGYLFSDPIGNSSKDNYIGHVGIWGITGIGNINNYSESQVELSANMFLLGINPTFSISRNFFSASLSTKFFHLRYNKIEGDLLFGGNNEIDFLSQRKNNFIVEPALTMRAGLKKLKFVWQFLYSNNLSYGNERQPTRNFSFGLTYNFLTRKKKFL